MRGQEISYQAIYEKIDQGDENTINQMAEITRQLIKFALTNNIETLTYEDCPLLIDNGTSRRVESLKNQAKW